MLGTLLSFKFKGTEVLSDLPKVIQLINSRPRIQDPDHSKRALTSSRRPSLSHPAEGPIFYVPIAPCNYPHLSIYIPDCTFMVTFLSSPPLYYELLDAGIDSVQGCIPRHTTGTILSMPLNMDISN